MSSAMPKATAPAQAPATEESAPARKPPPANGKPLETYEKLVRAAGELLGEVGFERLTTNGICARASLTPPAFYRYFNDKYDMLEVLAQRLLKRQNDAYAVWLFQGGSWADPETGVKSLEEWFAIAAEIVRTEPGAIWTMRALRALPNLAHVRLESQRMNTDRIFQFYQKVMPDLDPELLWQRLRIRAEFGWVVDELALEEDRLPHEVLFREAARMLGRVLRDEEIPLI
jgi:AcrR family transcriptional regulator